MKKPHIPLGCDQQGRYPEAAEAATEIGHEDNEEYVWNTYVILAVALFATIVLISFAIWT